MLADAHVCQRGTCTANHQSVSSHSCARSFWWQNETWDESPRMNHFPIKKFCFQFKTPINKWMNERTQEKSCHGIRIEKQSASKLSGAKDGASLRARLRVRRHVHMARRLLCRQGWREKNRTWTDHTTVISQWPRQQQMITERSSKGQN